MEALMLKPDEACEVLRVGRSKLYQLLKDGTLPSVRIGRSVRVPAESLRRWVARQTGGAEEGQL